MGSLDASQIELACNNVINLSQIKKNGKTTGENVTTAERLLQRLIKEVDANSAAAASVTPSLVKIWNALMLGYANLAVDTNKNPVNLVYPFETAHSLLRQMIVLHKANPSRHPAPTDHHYCTVLYACSNCSVLSDVAVETAEALIYSLEEQSDEHDDVSGRITPTVEMYNNVILAHANRAATVYGAATAAEDWLMHLSQRAAAAADGGNTVQPDTRSFNRVLKAWSHSLENNAANRAADILHLMLELAAASANNTHIQPDPVSFGTVITAFAKRKQPQACRVVLDEAIEYFTKTNTSNTTDAAIADLTQCWNAVCFGWAQSGAPDAPEQVEALLREAHNVHIRSSSNNIVRPDRAMYVACIEAHLNSGRPDRVEKAESHLRNMIDFGRIYRQEGQPLRMKGQRRILMMTTQEFDTVIHAWYRCQVEYEGNGTQQRVGRHRFGYAAMHAMNLLLDMLRLRDKRVLECSPATGTFNMCIGCWCETSRSCLIAAVQQSRPVRDSRPNAAVTIDTMNQQTFRDQAIAAALKAVELLDMAEVRRLSNNISYSNVIHALCRINDPDCSLKAAKLLDQWERATDDRQLFWPPHAVTLYTTVISALGKIGTVDAAELALKILRGIPKVGQRVVRDKSKLYAGVIAAFAKLPGQRTGVVATELFGELVVLDGDPESTVALDTALFESVLWALASAGDKVSAMHACDVLKFMLHLHLKGRRRVEPTTHCLNACIQALVECRDVTYTGYAVELIKVVVDNYEKKLLTQLPSPAAFYRVIRGCRDAGSGEMTQRANEIVEIATRLARSAGP